MRVAFPWRLRLASCAGSLYCAGHAAFGWLVSGEAVVFSLAISIQNIRNSPLEHLEQGDHIHFWGNLRRHKNETILNGDLEFPWDAPNVFFYSPPLRNHQSSSKITSLRMIPTMAYIATYSTALERNI
jgi:hypothetical protein